MTETNAGALPWPGQAKATDSETTPGGKEPTRWVAIGAHFNPGEALIIKGRLESHDIPAIVQQEAMGSVLGLAVGPLGSAKVLVPEPLVAQALAILAETFEVGEEEIWEQEGDDEE